MAKKQRRRSVSLNRHNHEAAKQEAARRGVTLSALVESALAAFGIPMVAHTQQTVALVQVVAARRAESAATAIAKETPIHRPSRERQVLGDRAADAYGFR